MKTIFYVLVFIGAGALSACNFSPGALLGDVTDDRNPYAYSSYSDYSYYRGSSLDSISSTGRGNECEVRKIAHRDVNRGCTVPGELESRISRIESYHRDELEIELNRDQVDDDFQVTSFVVMRRNFEDASYSPKQAKCQENLRQSRASTQNYVCRVSPEYGDPAGVFLSMRITNNKCGSYTDYTLPASCSNGEFYHVKYGSREFPIF